MLHQKLNIDHHHQKKNFFKAFEDILTFFGTWENGKSSVLVTLIRTVLPYISKEFLFQITVFITISKVR